MCVLNDAISMGLPGSSRRGMKRIPMTTAIPLPKEARELSLIARPAPSTELLAASAGRLQPNTSFPFCACGR